MATLNTIEKLAKLAAQRNARTDRLESEVHALLGALDKVTEVGDSAWDATGWHLTRVCSGTNVGTWDHWIFGNMDKNACDLDEAIGSDRYIHGDFHCQAHGPTREDLIRFAGMAAGFVEFLVTERADEIKKLETASAAVERATLRTMSLSELVAAGAASDD